MRDYAFDDLPARAGTGTALEVVNTSTIELHELVAIRLPDDEQRPLEELTAVASEAFGALLAGEPSAVLIAPLNAERGASEASAVVGDDTLTEPGRYLVLCTAVVVGTTAVGA